ncbi:hypothetical protein LCGC14_2718270 [marine sediment metagenome]|uniref:Uncharacterized protein n=1 Tax=marine sediment metagenome TaxID=412755 RepID=A0A0F8ZYG2_9ZZZZ
MQDNQSLLGSDSFAVVILRDSLVLRCGERHGDSHLRLCKTSDTSHAMKHPTAVPRTCQGDG